MVILKIWRFIVGEMHCMWYQYFLLERVSNLMYWWNSVVN